MEQFNKIIFFFLVIFLISGCSNNREESNPDSIAYCDSIKNKESQETCFINYAKKIAAIKEDEALIACKYINTSLSRDICFFEVVKEGPKSKNIGSYCIEIEDSSLRFKCLRIIERPHLAKLMD